MKLLLDEHYSPRIARELRKRGHDAVAAAERRDLTSSDDQDLLRAAARESRALLTNDVRDFTEIVRTWAAEGRRHHGVIFASDSTFPRASAGIGALVRALDATFAANQTDDAIIDQIIWLSD